MPTPTPGPGAGPEPGPAPPGPSPELEPDITTTTPTPSPTPSTRLRPDDEDGGENRRPKVFPVRPGAYPDRITWYSENFNSYDPQTGIHTAEPVSPVNMDTVQVDGYTDAQPRFGSVLAGTLEVKTDADDVTVQSLPRRSQPAELATDRARRALPSRRPAPKAAAGASVSAPPGRRPFGAGAADLSSMLPSRGASQRSGGGRRSRGGRRKDRDFQQEQEYRPPNFVLVLDDKPQRDRRAAAR